jgi:hypothetical protein
MKNASGTRVGGVSNDINEMSWQLQLKAKRYQASGKRGLSLQCVSLSEKICDEGTLSARIEAEEMLARGES